MLIASFFWLQDSYDAVVEVGYVVVNRRANTLFFENGDRCFGNPGAGTVIDTTVTVPGE